MAFILPLALQLPFKPSLRSLDSPTANMTTLAMFSITNVFVQPALSLGLRPMFAVPDGTGIIFPV